MTKQDLLVLLKPYPDDTPIIAYVYLGEKIPLTKEQVGTFEEDIELIAAKTSVVLKPAI